MILLLGGTSETGLILQGLCLPAHGEEPQRVLLCTATDEELSIPPAVWESGFAQRLCGRQDRADLAHLIHNEGVRLVVCAVHPYAAEARDNLLAAAKECGVPCLVYLRPGGIPEIAPSAALASQLPAASSNKPLNVFYAATHTESAAIAVRLAREGGGSVLLTTGSRHLCEYTQAAAVAGVRVYARVLDCPESREALAAAGIPDAQAIFGRGPFSADTNRGQIAACGAAVLVSKDSGEAGGVRQKLEAAQTAGCAVIMLERPEYTGAAYHTIPDLLVAIRKVGL